VDQRDAAEPGRSAYQPIEGSERGPN
jgi:hypothetical protein